MVLALYQNYTCTQLELQDTPCSKTKTNNFMSQGRHHTKFAHMSISIENAIAISLYVTHCNFPPSSKQLCPYTKMDWHKSMQGRNGFASPFGRQRCFGKGFQCQYENDEIFSFKQLIWSLAILFSTTAKIVGQVLPKGCCSHSCYVLIFQNKAILLNPNTLPGIFAGVNFWNDVGTYTHRKYSTSRAKV